jgi:TP901 family phage tail tape measure protein
VNDFNIIVGVNLVGAETKIKEMINDIGTLYPIKLTAVISNKTQFVKEITDITKLLTNIESLNVKIGGLSNLSKEMDKYKNSMTGLGQAVQRDMSNINHEAEEYKDNMQEALKTYDRLIKVGNRVDNKKGKTTVTQKSGNDFVQTTKQFNAEDMSAPEVKEVIADIKKLNDYVEKLTEKTNSWEHATKLLPVEVGNLLDKLSQLRGMMTKDPIGFDREIQNVRILEGQLTRLESNFASKFKGLDKAKKMVQSQDLGHVTQERKDANLNEFKDLQKMAESRNLGADYFGERLEAWISDYQKLIQENKENLKTQKEVDKLVSNISKQVAQWRENGNLSNKEIKEFEKTLKSIDVLSEHFTESLSKSKSEFVELNNKDKKITDEKADRERAINKIQEQRVSWQTKVNELERQGYTHKSQMKALQSQLNSLNSKELETLGQVNVHLQKMNEQYAKAVEFQKNKKLGVKRTENADKLTGKVEANLDSDLIGEKSIAKIKKEIDSIFSTQTVEELENAVRKVVKLYGDLIEKQKQAIEQKKTEVVAEQDLAKVRQHLADMERKTIEEQTKLANEENERKAKAYADRVKLEQDMASGMAKSERQRIEENAKEQAKYAKQVNKEQVDEYKQRVQDEQKLQEHLQNMDKKRHEEETKNANESHNHKAQLIAQEQKDWEAYYKARRDKEKEEAQKQIQEANAIHERQVQQHQEDARLAEQMNNGRAKSNKSKITQELTEAQREAQRLNAEQDRIYHNQERINKEYEEFDKVMNILRNSKFINESDFHKAKELIDGLSSESKTLAGDLNKVHNELQKVGRLSNSRGKKQENIDITQARNNNKADEVLSRGVVPKDLVNNFKELNNMLNFDSSLSDIEEIKQELAKIIKLEQDLNAETKNTERYEQLIYQAKENLTKVTDRYATRLEEISHMANRQINDTTRVAEVESKIAVIQDEINQKKSRGIELSHQEQREIQKQIRDVSRLVQSHRDEEAELNRIESTTLKLANSFESMSYRATRGFDRFPRQAREMNDYFTQIQAKINNLGNLRGTDFTKSQREIEKMMNDMSKRSRELREEIRESQNSVLGKFGRAMSQVPIWISAMSLFYGAMSQVRQGFENLLDMDKAMTNLKKVTEATSDELKQFKVSASEIGNELGVVASDVINATTSFQKLGYSLQQSTVLGRNSILYANVGDMSLDDATQNIISAVKGFNVEIDKSGENVQHVVDIFNNVSNNFAISASGIGQALRRSSAVLHDAGNTIEQSVALVTSANSTIQDPERVGTAMKTISMRLRGVQEDGSKVATLVPELEKAFNSFGASIMKDDKTFKSTYDIFDTLSAHWKDLTDVQKAYITELTGGKEQGAIVASMMNNWTDAVKANATAMNSAGSAQKEFSSYMDSFEYKIGQLKNALEEFWTTLINDDSVKGFIDFLTEAVNGLTEFTKLVGGGQITTNLLGMMAVLGSSSLRQTIFDKGKWTAIKGEISSATQVAMTAGTRLEGVSKGVKGIGSAISFLGGRVLWITAIISALTWVVQKSWEIAHKDETARKERVTTLDDEIKRYEALKEAMSSVDVSGYLSLEDKRNTTGLNTEEYQKYADIQKQIIQNMPELIAYYDEHGNAILRDSDTIRQLLRDKEEMYQKDKEEKFNLSVEDADFDKLQEKIKDVKDAMKKAGYSKEEEDALLFAKQWIINNKKALEDGKGDIQEKMAEVFRGFNSKMSDKNMLKTNSVDMFNANVTREIVGKHGNTDSAMKYIDEQIKKVRERTSHLTAEVDSAKTQVGSHIDKFSTMLDDGFDVALYKKGIKENSNEFLFMAQIKEQLKTDITEIGDKDVKEQMLKKIPKFVDEAVEELSKSHVDITKIINPTGNADEIKKNFDNVIKQFDSGTDFGNSMIQMLQRMRDEYMRTSQAMSQKPINPLTYAQDVAPVVDTYMNNISDLDSAYRSLNEGNSLTIKQTYDLMEKYPQLSKYLINHNGVVQLTKKAIMELAKAKEAEFKTDLQTKKAEMEASRAKAKDAITNIMSEIKAIQLLSGVNAKSMQQNMILINQQAQRQADMARMARNVGEDGVARQISNDRTQLIQQRNDMDEYFKIYNSMGDEIKKVNALLNTDFSSNLGKINSNDKKKDKKEMQDAMYVADKYKQIIDALNTSISILEAKQERYGKTSNTYKKLLQDEIMLTNAKKKAIDSQIASLENQIKKQSIIQTGLINLGKKDDNKTARAKQAEIQQEIDKAREALNGLKVESEQTMNKINELQMNLMEVTIDVYERQKNAKSDDIAYTEYMMGLYREGSQSYIDWSKTKLGYLKETLKYNQQEITYLEQQKKANKNLTDAQKAELDTRIDDARKSAYEASQAILELQTQINMFDVTEVTNSFSAEAEKYANAISDIRDKMKYDIKEDDYAGQINSLKIIMSLTKGQVNDAKNHISELEQMKEKYKDNHEIVDKISEEIKSWKDKLKESETGVKDLAQELEKQYQTVADNFVDIYKNQMQLMKQAEEDAYSDMMETEQKAHDVRMKQMDDELNGLRKIYDEKTKQMDREESTRTFTNDVDKMKDEAKQLQDQINTLSLDDSYEAKAKKSELVKQLADKNLEISEKQHQRELELRKNNLDDDLEKSEEQLNAKKDKYQQDFDDFKETEEKKKKERDKYWEQQLNDEAKFNQLREMAMNGSFDNMKTMLEGWKTDVSSNMSDLGDVITNNFTTRVEEAIKAMTELKGMDIGSLNSSITVGSSNLDASEDDTHINNTRDGSATSGSTVGSTGQDYNPDTLLPTDTKTNIGTVGQGIKDSQKEAQRHKATEQQKRYYVIKKGDTMSKIAEKYYGSATKWTKIRDANPKVNPSRLTIGSKLLIPFKTGGYTGDWVGDSGRLAILHKKELVLNQNQTKDILTTAKIMDKLRTVIPNLSVASNINNGGSTQSSNEHNEYNVSVHVENMNGDKKSADIVADQIIQKMKRTKGGRF